MLAGPTPQKHPSCLRAAAGQDVPLQHWPKDAGEDAGAGEAAHPPGEAGSHGGPQHHFPALQLQAVLPALCSPHFSHSSATHSLFPASLLGSSQGVIQGSPSTASLAPGSTQPGPQSTAF